MSGVVTELADGLLEIRLARPKVNALGTGVLRDIEAAFRRAGDDPDVRAVLLTAEGKCFSAGLDLAELAGFDRAAMGEFLAVFDAAFLGAFRCPKPVAAAVEGHAVAGGLILALVADQVFLGEGTYKLALTELAVGVPFPRVAFEIVNGALSGRALRHLVYHASPVDPEAGYALGIGDALTADPVGDARRWATLAGSRPSAAFRISKRNLRQAAEDAIAASGNDHGELLDALFDPETRMAMVAAVTRR